MEEKTSTTLGEIINKETLARLKPSVDPSKMPNVTRIESKNTTYTIETNEDRKNLGYFLKESSRHARENGEAFIKYKNENGETIGILTEAGEKYINQFYDKKDELERIPLDNATISLEDVDIYNEDTIMEEYSLIENRHRIKKPSTLIYNSFETDTTDDAPNEGVTGDRGITQSVDDYILRPFRAKDKEFEHLYK